MARDPAAVLGTADGRGAAAPLGRSALDGVAPNGGFWTLAFLAFAVASVYPLWHVRYAPLQDLPQHLAAVRVLFDYDAAEFGFRRFFELQPWRTQYLAYYGVVGVLSRVVDLEVANRIVLTACMVGTPYALRGLLTALGRDPRLAFLAFPLVYNAHLILGFFNFLAAIPLALWGITLAVKERRVPRRGRAIGLAVLAVACFYTHVVPFALMVLGVVLVSLGRDVRGMVVRLMPLVPAAAGALVWGATSPAGRATWTAARGSERGPGPLFTPWQRAFDETPMWLTDVWQDAWGVRLLLAWATVVAFALVVAPFLGRAPGSPDALARSLGRRLSVLAPLCIVLYFVVPASYDWIWPIASRFPLLALLFLVLVIPSPGRIAGHAVVLSAALLASAHFHFAGTAFARFDQQDVGDFDLALAQIPPGQRVAGLVFARGSQHVRYSPFLHYVAYYQARKGGAVMFTFADFPQSPFRFRAEARPPRVPPRWEWLPSQVDPVRDLVWYDWVLVRGGPGRIARDADAWRLAWRGRQWSVWARPSARLPRDVAGDT